MAAPLILYDNLADDAGAVLTASSTATGYDVDNLKDRKLFTFWKSTGGASEWIKIDMGGASTRYPTSIAISGHNLRTQTVTGPTIEYSDDDVVYAGASLAQEPRDMMRDTTMVGEMISGGATWEAGHRYWRVTFNGCDAAIQIACLTLGRALQFPEYMAQGFDPDAFALKNRAHRARGGLLIGAITDYVGQHVELKFGPAGLETTAFHDATGTPSWDDFTRNYWAKGKPFWFRWGGESTSAATNTIPRMGWYCWAGDNSKSSSPYIFRTRRGWKFGFEVSSEI